MNPDQMTLGVSEPRARHDDPETSRLAASSVVERRSELESLILITVTCHDFGMTDDEICAVLPRRHPPTVKTARTRLSNAGLLVDTGEKRLSNRQRSMIVWRRA